MLLDIQGVAQKTKTDCGPTALYMVLRYLGGVCDREEVENLVLSDKGGVTYTIGLALAASKLGYEVCYFSESFELRMPEVPYKHKILEAQTRAQQRVKKITNECRKLGVVLEERSPSIKEIQTLIQAGWVGIALLEYNHLARQPYTQYRGHFMPLLGWDANFMYVYDISLHVSKDELYTLTIPYKTFTAARKATDGDIVFIKQK